MIQFGVSWRCELQVAFPGWMVISLESDILDHSDHENILEFCPFWICQFTKMTSLDTSFQPMFEHLETA